jgi:hypothetical protein
MPSLPRPLAAPLALAALLAALGPACTANVEEGCLGGECVPPGGSPPIPPPGAGGGGGSGGGGGPTCEDTTDTGDFPCDVFTVLENNCHTCHQNPPQKGAPFSLLTYEDTQAPYGVMGGQRWQRMKQVVETGFMPLGSTLPDSDKQLLLGWLEGCAQPAADGMGCE